MSDTFPTPADAAYIARLRKDYPEKCAGQDDDWVMNYYNPAGYKYVESTLWDHLGEAAADFEQLADSHTTQVEWLRKNVGTMRRWVALHRAGDLSAEAAFKQIEIDIDRIAGPVEQQEPKS